MQYNLIGKPRDFLENFSLDSPEGSYQDRHKRALEDLKKGIIDFDLMRSPPYVVSLNYSIRDGLIPSADDYHIHNEYVRKAYELLFPAEYVKEIYLFYFEYKSIIEETPNFQYIATKLRNNIELGLSYNTEKLADKGLDTLREAKRNYELKEGERFTFIDETILDDPDNIIFRTTQIWIYVMEKAAFQIYIDLARRLGIASTLTYKEFINDHTPAHMDDRSRTLYSIFKQMSRVNGNFATWLSVVNHGFNKIGNITKEDSPEVRKAKVKEVLAKSNMLTFRQYFGSFIAKCGFQDVMNSVGTELFWEILEFEFQRL